MEGWKATRRGIRGTLEGGREGVREAEVDNVDEEDEMDKVATWEEREVREATWGGEMEG